MTDKQEAPAPTPMPEQPNQDSGTNLEEENQKLRQVIQNLQEEQNTKNLLKEKAEMNYQTLAAWSKTNKVLAGLGQVLNKVATDLEDMKKSLRWVAEESKQNLEGNK